MSLNEVNIQREYRIKAIETDDGELKDFLFTLGCYEGEPITVLSRDRHNLVIVVKDARYNIDTELAAAVMI